jgi:hypothetical protein
MVIVVTGMVGIDKKQYLAEVCEYAGQFGKRVKLYNLGEPDVRRGAGYPAGTDPRYLAPAAAFAAPQRAQGHHRPRRRPRKRHRQHPRDVPLAARAVSGVRLLPDAQLAPICSSA